MEICYIYCLRSVSRALHTHTIEEDETPYPQRRTQHGVWVGLPTLFKNVLVSYLCKILSHITVQKRKLVRCAHPTVILCVLHYVLLLISHDEHSSLEHMQHLQLMGRCKANQ